MLMGSPCFPNAIAWSQDNLIAVASGNLVTILVLSLSLTLSCLLFLLLLHNNR
jgi:hypothetical protein